MIHSARNYLYDRRRGLAKTVGVVGGAYLIGRYVVERLEEVREKVMLERVARDGLRRRFIQNQENISFTIMALIPTLGKQILEEMDVEVVTHELQTKSRAFRTPSELPPPPPPPLAPPSESSSIDLLHEHEAPSDVESVSASTSSVYGQDDSGVGSFNAGESSQSWVDQLSTQSSQPSASWRPSSASEPPLPDFMAGVQLSDSITTASSALSYGNANGDGQDMSRSEGQSSESSGTSNKSKAELWREVKMLTVTRTLTILYSTTLLALFTNIQLTLLARSKYVHSILQQERDERLRERLEYGASVWGGVGNLLDLENMAGGDDDDDEEISEQIEIKYLTLSWWILHVGWKDIAERVRRGVEEVFEGVSLKTNLGTIELHRLVSDVRRRVEYEVTFEGNERRINFLSSLLPPTTETMQHVLTQGGISPYIAAHHDPVFSSLLDETRNLIKSSDFERVLELGLDRATDVLFDGLQKNVFVDPNSPQLDESQNSVRLRLAGLLPGLARWSHLALNGLPNELVDNVTGLREAAAFSAIIFSTFEDRYR